MQLTWAPLALFSLVAAKPVTPVYEIPDFERDYNFRCGEVRSNCQRLYSSY